MNPVKEELGTLGGQDRTGVDGFYLRSLALSNCSTPRSALQPTCSQWGAAKASSPALPLSTARSSKAFSGERDMPLLDIPTKDQHSKAPS